MKNTEELIKFIHSHKGNTQDFEMAILEVLNQVKEHSYVSGYMAAIEKFSDSPSTHSKSISESWIHFKNKNQ